MGYNGSHGLQLEWLTGGGGGAIKCKGMEGTQYSGEQAYLSLFSAYDSLTV